MNRSSKAMMLSTLLFPGVGLFLLRKHLLGTLLAGTAVVALAVLLRTAVGMAQSISEQILRGEIPLEIPAILEAVHHVAALSGAQANLASMLFLGCWVVGMLLTSRAGRNVNDD